MRNLSLTQDFRSLQIEKPVSVLLPENKVDYDDTHQGLHGSCVKFSQIAVMVLKNTFRN